jgi:SAM-dependent methyltransferase
VERGECQQICSSLAILLLELNSQSPLYQASLKNFPKEKFPDLDIRHGDARNLEKLENESFDVVWFPQNGLDYVPNYEQRQQVLQEMKKKVKTGGLVIFSSHSKQAYIYSPKVSFKNKCFKILEELTTMHQKILLEVEIFQRRSRFVIQETEKNIGLKFIGFTGDARTKLDRFLMRKFKIAKYVFPYIQYVLKNSRIDKFCAFLRYHCAPRST